MSKLRISRRRFIGRTLAGLTVVATTQRGTAALALPDSSKIGVALVGLGGYASNQLAPALQLTGHCELRGIVTGTPAKIPVWQRAHGIPDANVYNYENMHLVANNPDIDVLYIVVPTALHRKYTERAAQAGKHVWCEKPMAMTEADCQAMIECCRRNKVQLAIGYRLQHEPNTRTVIAYARSRPYGVIKELIAEAGYAGGAPAPGNWRLKRAMGGGALYDMGVYPINAARYTSRLEPTAVTARLEVDRPEIFAEVDESAFLILEFPGGLTAACASSVGRHMNRLRANCAHGWYELSPMQSYTGVQGRTSDGTLLNQTIVNQQAAQMDDDALAILGSGPLLVAGDEGLADIRVVEAALRSAASGQRVAL